MMNDHSLNSETQDIEESIFNILITAPIETKLTVTILRMLKKTYKVDDNSTTLLWKYFGLLFSSPEIFSREHLLEEELKAFNTSIQKESLHNVRIFKDSTLIELFISSTEEGSDIVLKYVLSELIKCPDFENKLKVFEYLMTGNKSREVISDHPYFVFEDIQRPNIIRSILNVGPFERKGNMQLMSFLGSSSGEFLSREIILDRQETFYKYINEHNKCLYKIILSLISGKQNVIIREKIFNYFSSCCEINKDMAKLEYNKDSVTEKNFSIGIMMVLLSLYKGVDIKKVIETDLLFEGSEIIRINSKESPLEIEKKAYLKKNEINSNPKKISNSEKLFVLASMHVHLNIPTLFREYEICVEDEDRIKEFLKENTIPKDRAALLLKTQKDMQHSYEVYLMSDEFIGILLSYYAGLMELLIEVYKENRGKFMKLPEYLLVDTTNFLVPLAESGALFDSGQVIDYIETFLIDKGSINNPHIKVDLIELLYRISSGRGGCKNLRKGTIEELIGIYGNKENNKNVTNKTRYQILDLVKREWNHSREIIVRLSKEKEFLYFCNRLIGDIVLFLDEIFSEEDASNRDQEKDIEGIVGLAILNLNLLTSLSGIIKKPFLEPSLIGRIFSFFNRNIRRVLRSNLEKKKEILKGILSIFGNLQSTGTVFASLIAEDEQYNRENMNKTLRIIRDNQLENEAYISRFKGFLDTVDKIIDKNVVMEEIPENYLDPVMYTIMRDPVKLPTSGITMDRKVISGFLLEDNRDPFNRKELKVEDLTDDIELREEIKRYLERSGESNK
eukprot:GHVP01020077.1.p1 GENE.GHVP01020077.1~~GHVP01020077.1.p1  ORF type:complete len:789 (-),score=131.27 GHVP01020077.1:964-3330(-)